MFWRDQFLKACADFADAELHPILEELAAEVNREAAASERPRVEKEAKETRPVGPDGLPKTER